LVGGVLFIVPLVFACHLVALKAAAAAPYRKIFFLGGVCCWVVITMVAGATVGQEAQKAASVVNAFGGPGAARRAAEAIDLSIMPSFGAFLYVLAPVLLWRAERLAR
jgi:hypothetical protein